jgi:4-hydroxy-2-oxoheptanedioate aldolase
MAMELPVNRFKRALQVGRAQIGLWCTLSSAYATELVAGSGFDWLLLDTEHSPGDVLSILPQLQALAGYPGLSPVVRPASNDPVLIKRFLDIGVQTLLVPFVQTAEEARAAVRAMRYPPDGIRGVSAVTRATGFGRVADYGKRAATELCLLVQVETREALDQIEAIAAVDGVDGIFIGPGDLAASFGLIGQINHASVMEAINGAMKRITAAGKPCGILTADLVFARSCLDAGVTFVAVGVDAAILARQVDALAREFIPCVDGP